MALALTACSKAPAETTTSAETSTTTSETTEATTSETTEETTEATTTAAPDPFVFEPHINSETLSGLYEQKYFDGLYNLIDALRKGEDTFECSDKAVYEFAFDPVVLNNMFPIACMKVEEAGFADGVGKIGYRIPVEEFMTKEADFEKMIVDILNDNAKTTDSDIEKCLKLYDYMATEYDYEYEELGEHEYDPDCTEGSCYETFMIKKGICCELGCAYSYLLMQAGVDALLVGEDENMCHAWSYVTLNGNHYHIDPTWALKSCYYDENCEDQPLILDYFLMSDAERANDQFEVKEMTMDMSPNYWVNHDGLKFTATDDTYCNAFDCSVLVDLDTENNIIYYDCCFDEPLKFHYED